MSPFHLKESPLPQGEHYAVIRKHPKTCYVCYNLHSESAYSIYPKQRLRMNPNFLVESANKAAGREGLGDSFSYEGANRIKYLSWAFEAYLVELRDSAAQGCITCLLLMEALIKLTKEDIDFNDASLFIIVVFFRSTVLRIRLVRGDELEEDEFDFVPWEESEVKEILGHYELYTLHGRPCPWPTIGSSMDLDGAEKTFFQNLNGGTARHIDSNPSSESFFNLATEWINSCKTQHSICAEADLTTTRNLPKRVIDVGPDTNDGIRVFEHNDLLNRLDEPYTALSHCWGKSQHLTSTHKNNTLDRWKQDIPFDLLPPTFQDAIVMTRKLNIKYVWIDSLCIIQDDAEDWELEAAKMASIYNGADLVLAATGSIDGDGGCLFERAPFVTISGSFPDGGPYEIYGRASNRHAAFGLGADMDVYKGTQNYISREDPDVPLLSRAWCFQERLLATRILHFTRYEAVFDCLTCIECECGALHEHADDFLVSPRRIIKTGHKYVDDTRSVKGTTAEIQARRSLPPPSQAEKEFSQHHELWRDMIVQYSTKRITYKKDGFPAIAGLATNWSNDTTGRYLAGLWEKALLDGLRWGTTQKDSGEELEYIAPSWSWLSVQREVEWGLASFDGMEYYVQVDYSRTKCHPKSDLNPFGEVSCGYIFLTGQITTISYKLKGDTAWVYGEDGAYQSLSRVDSLHRLRNLEAKELFCLRLGTKTKHFPGQSDSCALVLMKADAKDLARQPREVREFPNVYQRVHFLGRWELGEVSEEKEMYLI